MSAGNEQSVEELNNPTPTKNKPIKKLYKALADFQNEVPVIHQGATGYGYTYADLNSIFSVIKPLLKKNGLGFTQLLDGDSLKTIIFHIQSGETIESSVNIQQNVQLAKMNTFQVLGSAITYYRRYSLSAALGLITDKDIDACGEVSQPKQPSVKDSMELLKSSADLNALKVNWSAIGDYQNDAECLALKEELKLKLK